MNTTVVNASDLGDDWTPAAHLPRLVTQITNVQPGDRIRVRDHQGTYPGDREPQWHLVTVLDFEQTGSTVALGVDLWPIAYVAASDTLVELVEITREVSFVCDRCPRNGQSEAKRLTVPLEEFFSPALMRDGGLQVLELRDLTPATQRGLCPAHTNTLLD